MLGDIGIDQCGLSFSLCGSQKLQLYLLLCLFVAASIKIDIVLDRVLSSFSVFICLRACARHRILDSEHSLNRSRRRRGRSLWWSSPLWTGDLALGGPSRARNRLLWWNPTSAATAAPFITVRKRSVPWFWGFGDETDKSVCLTYSVKSLARKWVLHWRIAADGGPECYNLN